MMLRIWNKVWCVLFHYRYWKVYNSEAFSNRTMDLYFKCGKCGSVHKRRV